MMTGGRGRICYTPTIILPGKFKPGWEIRERGSGIIHNELTFNSPPDTCIQLISSARFAGLKFSELTLGFIRIVAWAFLRRRTLEPFDKWKSVVHAADVQRKEEEVEIVILEG